MRDRKIRLLVVEDRVADAELVEIELRRAGLDPEMRRVEDEETLSAALSEHWDLILSDYSLPTLTAHQVMHLVKERQPSTPVIIISGTVSEELAVDAIHAGARDFISKSKLSRLPPAVEREILEATARAERARMQRAFDEAREQLRAVLEFAPTAILATDREGTVRFANKALGVPNEEVIGKRWLDLLPVEEAERLEGLFQEVLESGGARHGQVSRPNLGGQATWLAFVMGPIRHGPNVTGVIVCLQDISDLKLSQERLRVSDRLASIGALASGVAHDFNNILSVIRSFTTLAKRGLDENDQRNADLDEVLRAADRAVALTRQLLTFSRHQPRLKRATDLNERILLLESLLRRTVGENVHLVCLRSSVRPTILIDPTELDQLLLNLAVNARDAMPTGGTLTIASSVTSEEYVELSISDTGHGIPPAIRGRIFEPFFTTKEPGKGTGLGLATCASIVEDAKGTITVESNVGQGTVFRILLPLTREKVDSDRGSDHLPPRGHGELVLVAEDEPALRSATQRVLESSGYNVHAVSNGAEAIAAIDRLGTSLNVVFSDIVMPGLSGYDVAEHARRVIPEVPVILTSGYVTDAAVQNHRADLALMWKPVSEKDLLEALGRALASRPVAKSLGPVLIVEDNISASKALARLLSSFDIPSVFARSNAEAEAQVSSGLNPRAILCDLTLEDGSATQFLSWLVDHHPGAIARTLVLTGGATDEVGRDLISSRRFRILYKPYDPKELLDFISGQAPPSEPAPPPPLRSSVAPKARNQDGDRVLVVDDDDALLMACGRILREAGFLVETASTLDSARTILRSMHLDGVVADIGLPDGTGFDLLPLLQGELADLPVVIVTGAPSFESATQALRHRVHEYLAKPFAAQDLVRVTKAAVETGRFARLRSKLLAARHGAESLLSNLPKTDENLTAALQKIRMEFQPIVWAKDSRVFGFEALLRSDEPSLKAPQKILAAAEILGRVHEVGKAVRRSVARTLTEIPRVEAIFVNLHPMELRLDLLSEAEEPLTEKASQVVLEITERASLEAGTKLESEVQGIRNLGYRIAVDDLGEGYSGLTSLVHLRPDVVKVDMSLVRHVDRSPLKREVVHAIVNLARRSNILVVAEGVETTLERSTLLDLGCDLFQGWLFAKAGPPFPEPRNQF